jgi:pyrrolidone-carboxylate peptidase
MSRVVIRGFGPFLDIADNPAGRLAEALDGQVAAGRVIEGRVTDTTWDAGARALAEATGAELLLGIGVARGRSSAAVERFGRRALDPAIPDVRGAPAPAWTGPEVRACPDAEALADALGVGLSDDAGRYVCNAFLYIVLDGKIPAFFLHIPPSGFPMPRLLDGLARFLLTTRRA